MSGQKSYSPANRLSDALSKARPLSVEQCLKQADENLKQISLACVDHVDRSLELLEKKFGEWPSTQDPAYVDALYQLSLRLIGPATTAGLPDLDRAAASLCETLDGLTARKTFDRDPVKIHIGALRLLRSPAGLGDGVAALLAGLVKVRARYVAM